MIDIGIGEVKRLTVARRSMDLELSGFTGLRVAPA
jgi:hypothetical protein